MEKIAAIVVTFNRLELLKKVVGGLRNQTRKPDQIIIVNNSSSDGTSEWLAAQSDLLVITQENLGSSGGQYAGAKYAWENGFDFIWLMDDDVVAEPQCLEIMFSFRNKVDIICPLRYNSDEVYFNDITKINFSNPLKSIWAKIICPSDLENELISVEGFTFEGPLFSREVIDEIGLPELGFFIYADDTEFSVRAYKKGLKAAIARDARFDRMIPPVADKGDFTWKHFYLIRNLIAIDRLHGDLLLRNLRPFGYLITWLKASKSFADIKTVFKAFFSAMKYKSQN